MTSEPRDVLREFAARFLWETASHEEQHLYDLVREAHALQSPSPFVAILAGSRMFPLPTTSDTIRSERRFGLLSGATREEVLWQSNALRAALEDSQASLWWLREDGVWDAKVEEVLATHYLNVQH